MRYRYPGIQPFSIQDSDIFFGREKDIDGLTTAILVEQIVVLHSKSGMGKSSLIQAGLVPSFKQGDKLFPITIRLGAWQQEQNQEPLIITNSRISLEKNPSDYLDAILKGEDSLWYKLKKLHWQINGSTETKEIVLIFDQFEELFTYPEQQIVDFKNQLAEMLYIQVPQRVRDAINLKIGPDKIESHALKREIAHLYQNLEVKVLFSIRSDKLSLMDSMSDVIPSILHQWFELKPLRLGHAEDAILEPAYSKSPVFASKPFDYTNEALDKILNFLSNDKKSDIESFQLQIICQYAEMLSMDEQKLLLGVADFEDIESIFKNYYDRQISHLPEEYDKLAARKLIEEGLIFEKEERRINLYEGQIFDDYNITPKLLQSLVANRLIRPESDIRGGMTYELCHDTLVKPILESKKRRIEKEKIQYEKSKLQKARKRRLIVYLGVLALFTIMTIGIMQIYFAKQKADKLARIGELLTLTVENEKIEPNLAMWLAESAYQLDKTNPNSNRIRGKIFSDNQFYSHNFTHGRALFSASFTPDDQYLLIGGGENVAKLWNLESKKAVAFFRADVGQMWNLEASEDGKYVLAAGSKKNLVVWDFQSRSIINRFQGYIGWSTFVPGKDEIIMAVEQGAPRVEQYEIHSGHLSQAYDFFSPGGRIVGVKFLRKQLFIFEEMSGGETEAEFLKIWDGGKQEVIQTLSLPNNSFQIKDVDLSQDGKYLLTGHRDGSLILWNVHTGQFVRRYAGHIDDVSGIKFARDGNTFASSGWDNKAFLWRTHTGELISTFNAHKVAISGIAYSHDEKKIVTVSWDGTAKIWPSGTGKEISSWKAHEGVGLAMIVTTKKNYIITGGSKGTIHIWDLDGKLIRNFLAHYGSKINDLAISPDENYLFSTGEDKHIHVRKLPRGELIHTFQPDEYGVGPIAISPDGKLGASGSMNNNIHIWQTENMKILHTLSGHKMEVTDLVFSADGQSLLSGSRDSTALLWNITSGKLIQAFSGGHRSRIMSVAYSPQDEYVLTGGWDGNIILWDIHTGEMLHYLPGSESVASSYITSDGKYLFTGHEDQIVKKWNLNTQKIEQVFKLAAEVHRLAYLPRQQYLITGSKDNRINIYATIDAYLKSDRVAFPSIVDQQNVGIELHNFETPSRDILQQYANELIYQAGYSSRQDLQYPELKLAASIQSKILGPEANKQDSIEASAILLRYAKSCLFKEEWKASLKSADQAMNIGLGNVVEIKAIQIMAHLLAGDKEGNRLLEDSQGSKEVLNRIIQIKNEIRQEEPSIELAALEVIVERYQ